LCLEGGEFPKGEEKYANLQPFAELIIGRGRTFSNFHPVGCPELKSWPFPLRVRPFDLHCEFREPVILCAPPDNLFVQISVFFAVGVQNTSYTPNSAQKDLDFCYDVLLGILEGLKHRDNECESYFSSTNHIIQQGKLIPQ
jgi:hypothetical protein